MKKIARIFESTQRRRSRRGKFNVNGISNGSLSLFEHTHSKVRLYSREGWPRNPSLVALPNNQLWKPKIETDPESLSIHINDGEAICIPFTTAWWFNHR